VEVIALISPRLSILRRVAAGFLLAAALVDAQSQPSLWVQVVDDFSSGSSGWLPEFSDYNFGTADLQRAAEIRALPEEIGVEASAYFLQSDNHSDDLFMYLKKPLGFGEGIVPGASYEVEFLVEFASAAPSGCSGVGGAPGESVVLKAGASAVEPVAILSDQGLRLNLDKGAQSENGRDAVIAGNVANGIPCEESQGQYVLLEKRARLPQPVVAGDTGELWIFFGTDSGFEGLTRLYYSRVVALLTRVSGGVQ
jgi:hypothetical protein